MDCNETLRRINDFLRAGEEGEEVDEWCWDLYSWIVDKQGFAPNWDNYPLGTEYYKSRLAYMRSGEDN